MNKEQIEYQVRRAQETLSESLSYLGGDLEVRCKHADLLGAARYHLDIAAELLKREVSR